MRPRAKVIDDILGYLTEAFIVRKTLKSVRRWYYCINPKGIVNPLYNKANNFSEELSLP